MLMLIRRFAVGIHNTPDVANRSVHHQDICSSLLRPRLHRQTVSDCRLLSHADLLIVVRSTTACQPAAMQTCRLQLGS